MLTSARHLSVILRDGLRPRKKNRRSNWDGAASNPDAVYLTTAYAPYYALCTLQGKQDKLSILEVDTYKLRQSRLCPDEDFLEQATRKIDERGGKSNHPEWGRVDMHARTAAYHSVMLSEYQDKWDATLPSIPRQLGKGRCNDQGRKRQEDPEEGGHFSAFGPGQPLRRQGSKDQGRNR